MIRLPPALMPASAERFESPRSEHIQFEGFSAEAFDILDRLKAHPHIEQYRRDKDAIARWIQQPFKRYRDDLVINWVLPNGLPFETEKNVFSRLLKNDFGAGGCHHHQWMSFYRPPRRRLSDVQLSHSIYPDGFVFGLYAGEYAKGLFRSLKQRMTDEPARTLDLVNALIECGYTFTYAPTVSKSLVSPTFAEPLDSLPDDLGRAKGLWVRRSIPKETVLRLGGDLVGTAIRAQAELWPLYRWWATSESDAT